MTRHFVYESAQAINCIATDNDKVYTEGEQASRV